jgi:hypothetical protein
MTVNELMAVAAHLHVILRRKTGRVTDIEWLVANPDYAQAIADFAKLKAKELADTDLELWALKLELANQHRPVRGQKPLVQLAIDSVQANQAKAMAADSLAANARVAAEPEPAKPENSAGRYIGGIR